MKTKKAKKLYIFSSSVLLFRNHFLSASTYVGYIIPRLRIEKLSFK